MKRIKTLTILLAAAITAIMLNACGSNVFGEKINEGVITYKLDADGSTSNNLAAILPEQMTMTFKDNNTLMTIKGYAGCFVLNAIANDSQKKSYMTLSIGFNQKYMLVADFGEKPFGTEIMSDLKITNTTDTMSICGYLCHKSIGHSDQCNRNFTFWYTKDIKITSDCIISPIKSIDGVVMAFDVEMFGIYMQAKAIEVNRTEVSDDTFEKPEGFNEVSRKELEDVIHTFDGSKKES